MKGDSWSPWNLTYPQLRWAHLTIWKHLHHVITAAKSNHLKTTRGEGLAMPLFSSRHNSLGITEDQRPADRPFRSRRAGQQGAIHTMKFNQRQWEFDKYPRVTLLYLAEWNLCSRATALKPWTGAHRRLGVQVRTRSNGRISPSGCSQV